jgi:hypothetical protein
MEHLYEDITLLNGSLEDYVFNSLPKNIQVKLVGGNVDWWKVTFGLEKVCLTIKYKE